MPDVFGAWYYLYGLASSALVNPIEKKNDNQSLFSQTFFVQYYLLEPDNIADVTNRHLRFPLTSTAGERGPRSVLGLSREHRNSREDALVKAHPHFHRAPDLRDGIQSGPPSAPGPGGLK